MVNETLMTAAGQAALEAELEELKARRPEMAATIKAARELGDLKENAEYHAAKDAQGSLETRILQIEAQLRTAVVIEADASESITVGSTVVIHDLDMGEDETWKITGVAEADPLENRISYESPIGSALMGHVPGDEVDIALPRGAMKVRIVSVS
jgi:transcription elongation factor GreA